MQRPIVDRMAICTLLVALVLSACGDDDNAGDRYSTTGLTAGSAGGTMEGSETESGSVNISVLVEADE